MRKLGRLIMGFTLVIVLSITLSGCAPAIASILQVIQGIGGAIGGVGSVLSALGNKETGTKLQQIGALTQLSTGTARVGTPGSGLPTGNQQNESSAYVFEPGGDPDSESGFAVKPESLWNTLGAEPGAGASELAVQNPETAGGFSVKDFLTLTAGKGDLFNGGIASTGKDVTQAAATGDPLAQGVLQTGSNLQDLLGIITTGKPPSTGGVSGNTATTSGSGAVTEPGNTPVSQDRSAQQQLYDRFNIVAQDSEGEVIDGCRISAGEADSSVYETIFQVISTLPETFWRCTSKILLASSIVDAKGGSLGLFDEHTSKLYLKIDGYDFVGTIVHEMTHAFQLLHEDTIARWKEMFWNNEAPKTSSVSDYGNRDPWEDMAETMRLYYESGQSIKQSHPDRYEFIRRYVMGGKEFS